MSSNDQTNPSLIGGHAQFAKGAAVEAIGTATGAETWTSSGEQDKKAGIDAMKAAGENRDSSSGMGKVEEQAGKLVGCEGMEKEGAESKPESSS